MLKVIKASLVGMVSGAIIGIGTTGITGLVAGAVCGICFGCMAFIFLKEMEKNRIARQARWSK